MWHTYWCTGLCGNDSAGNPWHTGCTSPRWHHPCTDTVQSFDCTSSPRRQLDDSRTLEEKQAVLLVHLLEAVHSCYRQQHFTLWKLAVFLDMARCSVVDTYWRFGGTCLTVQVRRETKKADRSSETSEGPRYYQISVRGIVHHETLVFVNPLRLAVRVAALLLWSLQWRLKNADIYLLDVFSSLDCTGSSDKIIGERWNERELNGRGIIGGNILEFSWNEWIRSWKFFCSVSRSPRPRFFTRDIPSIQQLSDRDIV